MYGFKKQLHNYRGKGDVVEYKQLMYFNYCDKLNVDIKM